MAFAACVALSLTAWLTLRAVLPLPGAAGLVDVRPDKRRHDFSIVLNVRDAGAYGHARMTWIEHRDDVYQAFSFGYYADEVGNVLEAFDTSGSLIDEGQNTSNITNQTRLALVFWVDQEQFASTVARIDRWRGKGRYKLFTRDCTAFIADMVEPLGLKMPTRLFFPRPYDFVVGLLEANAQRVRS